MLLMDQTRLHFNSTLIGLIKLIVMIRKRNSVSYLI